MISRERGKVIFVVPFVAALALASCGQPETSDEDAHVHSLIVKNPASRWSRNSIRICFLNPGEVTSEVVSSLTQHAISQLARTGVVTLTGWDRCNSGDLTSEVIRVRFLIPSSPGASWGGGISHVGRASSGLGVQSAQYAPLSNAKSWSDGSGTKVDMGLATLAVYVRQSWPRDSFGQISQKGTFVHEIGHALGLYHEQDRHDSACRTSSSPDASRKLPVGTYDASSLMNYCANYQSTGGTFSTGDLAGIRLLFAR